MAVRGFIRILTVTLGLVATATFAEDEATYTPDEYADAIVERILEIEETFFNTDADEGMRQALALNTEVDQYQDFMAGHSGFWSPDLLVVRLALRLDDFETVIAYSAPLVQALNTDEHRAGRNRVEGMFYLARGLFATEQFGDAEAVLRSFATVATPENIRKSSLQSADYMLAHSVSNTNPPDADAIRHRILDAFMMHENASIPLYLRIWFDDLNAHYSEGATPLSTVKDARHVTQVMMDLGPDAVGEYQALYGLLARIFADNEDFASALPLLEARMEYLAQSAPEIPDRFWAWQNLAGVRNLQLDFAGAMKEASAGLKAIDALDDTSDREFNSLRAAFEALISVAAEGLGEARISQDALQRAYTWLRQNKSANDPEVVALAARMNKNMVDPAVFEYAAELGLDAPQSMAIHLDGNGVIDAFFAGRYAQTGRVLAQLGPSDGIPADVIAMQWAYHYALLGEIGPGLEQIKLARKSARQSLGAHMSANDYHPDLAEALLMIYARDFEPQRGAAALKRLENRTDLPDQIQAVVRMLRATYLHNDGHVGDANVLYQQIEQNDFAYVDTSAWGTVLALGLLNLSLQIEDVDTARNFAPAYREEMATHPDRALATVVLQIFMLNADPGAINLESGFQALAFHIRTLSRMLPDAHQWNIAANVAYASALSGRNQNEEAAALLADALKNYRKSPWHRPDVAAFLQTTRAWSVWSLGQEELAVTLFAQANEGVDLEGWRGTYVTTIVMAHAFGQWVQGQYDEALQTMESVLERDEFRARLAPQDAVLLYTRYGEFLMYSDMADAAKVAFDSAVAAVPSPEYNKGFTLAEALQRRALFHATQDRARDAFADITQSNDLWFSYYESGDVARAEEFDRARVVEEAKYGWALHLQLEGEK